MTNIRRYDAHDRPIFVTAVCERRSPHLRDSAAKELLLSVLREARSESGWSMIGWVIMDDHLHALVRLAPEGDISRLMQSVKLRFVRRRSHRASGDGSGRVWQRRFWDHIIRDERDFDRHLDYIHYNPVRHGCVACPRDYPWSSFHAHLARGRYEPDWGCNSVRSELAAMELE